MRKISLMLITLLAIMITCKNQEELNRKLLLSVQVGNIEKVRTLIKKGADPYVQDKTMEGRTPLLIATAEGYIKIVALLIEKGSNVNAKGGDGTTALILGSWLGNEEIVVLLLSKGAAVDAKDHSGNTALIASAGKGYVDIVELLLSGKANINMRNNSGFTPLMMARLYDHPAVEKLLKMNGALLSADDTKKIASAMKSRKSVDDLLEKGKKTVKKFIKDAVDGK